MIGICIPAHDEEAFIGRCLDAVFLASRHPDLRGEAVRVVLVLDSCTDASAALASRWPAIQLSTRIRNVGQARAIGAADLLHHGARWLAFTDADSRVSPRWLVDQLSLRADVVCGTIEIDDWAAHGRQAAHARRRFSARYTDRDGHRHVHGANLGISAWHYRRAGGFEARRCGEDQALVDRLASLGARIAWSALPRVTTSARPYSRVDGGFAAALRRGWLIGDDQQPDAIRSLVPTLATAEVTGPMSGTAGDPPLHLLPGD